MSAERQNRTDDTAIFSRVLYQLSYLGDRVGYFLSVRDFTSTYMSCQAKFLAVRQQNDILRIVCGYVFAAFFGIHKPLLDIVMGFMFVWFSAFVTPVGLHNAGA